MAQVRPRRAIEQIDLDGHADEALVAVRPDGSYVVDPGPNEPAAVLGSVAEARRVQQFLDRELAALSVLRERSVGDPEPSPAAP